MFSGPAPECTLLHHSHCNQWSDRSIKSGMHAESQVNSDDYVMADVCNVQRGVAPQTYHKLYMLPLLEHTGRSAHSTFILNEDRMEKVQDQ